MHQRPRSTSDARRRADMLFGLRARQRRHPHANIRTIVDMETHLWEVDEFLIPDADELASEVRRLSNIGAQQVARRRGLRG